MSLPPSDKREFHGKLILLLLVIGCIVCIGWFEKRSHATDMESMEKISVTINTADSLKSLRKATTKKKKSISTKKKPAAKPEAPAREIIPGEL